MGLPCECFFLEGDGLNRVLSSLSSSEFNVAKNDYEDSFEIALEGRDEGVTLWQAGSRDGLVYISIIVSFPTDELVRLFSDISRLIEKCVGSILSVEELRKIGPHLR